MVTNINFVFTNLMTMNWLLTFEHLSDCIKYTTFYKQLIFYRLLYKKCDVIYSIAKNVFILNVLSYYTRINLY